MEFVCLRPIKSGKKENNKNRMKAQFNCNNSIITIYCGDITETDCDVIVSSDNASLQMSYGVSKAIIKAGGDAIANDVNKFPKSLSLGDVVVSTAGDLPHKYIFHCITDKIGNKRSIEVMPTVIEHSICKCVQLMSMLEMHSIAMPAIGTGAVGLPPRNVAEIMCSSLYDSLHVTNKSFHIQIVVYKESDLNTFVDVFAQDEHLCKENPEATTNELPVAPTHKEYDVFISYSWQNKPFAHQLRDWLESLHLNYFLDENELPLGEDLRDRIAKSIRKTKLVLFLSSESSNTSPACNLEISYATCIGVKVLPIRLDMYPYSDKFQMDLLPLLYLEALDQNLTDDLKEKLLDNFKLHRIIK